MSSQQNIKLVENILSEKLKTKIHIGYVTVEEHTPTEEDPAVKTALDTFKGKVVSRWHNE